MSTNWEREELFFQGESYFDHLIECLKKAQKSIYFESYIFAPGRLSSRLVVELRAAAFRGVEVKLLLDGVGSLDFPLEWGEILEGGGVQIRFYHPVPWAFNIPGKRPMNFLAPFLNFFLRFQIINKRNHRKMIIIDEQKAFLGSFNVMDDQLYQFVGENRWIDYGVQVEGEAIDWLLEGFRFAWESHNFLGTEFNFEKKREILELNPQTSLVRLNFFRKLRKSFYADFLERIDKAKNRLYLVSPYFVPDNLLLKKLIDSAKRGVEVCLLTTQKTDLYATKILGHYFFQILVENGIRVFEYQPYLLHAKMGVIDDYCYVGSSNLNHRSVIHDLEADVVISQFENQNLLIAKFQASCESAYEMKKQDFEKRKWYERILCKFLLLLKYWA